MRHTREKSHYLSFLLRMWQTTDGAERTWRASLERPGTGERIGFASIHALITFLEQETADFPTEPAIPHEPSTQ